MNKRIIVILLSSILVSGCFFGDVGSGYITKVCTKKENYDDVEVTLEKIIKSKENNVIKITFNNSLMTEKLNNTFNSLRNSYISEMKDLSILGIKTEELEDMEGSLKISYEFELNEISDDIKKKYEFEELNHNQIKKYEEEGYECE